MHLICNAGEMRTISQMQAKKVLERKGEMKFGRTHTKAPTTLTERCSTKSHQQKKKWKNGEVEEGRGGGGGGIITLIFCSLPFLAQCFTQSEDEKSFLKTSNS